MTKLKLDKFMLWEQGVEGSNPFAPTTLQKKACALRTSLFSLVRPL